MTSTAWKQYAQKCGKCANKAVQNIELIDNFDILNKKTSISVDEKVV